MLLRKAQLKVVQSHLLEEDVRETAKINERTMWRTATTRESRRKAVIIILTISTLLKVKLVAIITDSLPFRDLFSVGVGRMLVFFIGQTITLIGEDTELRLFMVHRVYHSTKLNAQLMKRCVQLT